MTAAAKPYSVERDMVQTLRAVLPPLFRPRASHAMGVLVEPTVGSVIPDLLMGIWLRATSVLPLPRLSFVEASVLSVVQQNKTIVQEDLFTRIRLTQSGAIRVMDRLLKTGSVRIEDKIVRYAGTPKSRDGEVIAFEAKLRRWREALNQAAEYRRFADRSYVVLDGAQVIPDAVMIESHRSEGVGLIVQRGKQVELLLRAKRNRVVTADRIQALRKLSTEAASTMASC